MFETAIFTDCLESESVTGAPGFQFEAVSPGFDGSDQSFSAQNMLHAVSPRWDQEHDPTTQPRSFRFLTEKGRCYFSWGKSTGDTNTGRRGNQLTQIARADSLAGLGAYRPAQILLAEDWSLEKLGTRSAPTWNGPLTIPEDAEFDVLIPELLADAFVDENLAAMITHAEAATRNPNAKFYIVSSDSRSALRLIAMLSFLLGADAMSGMSIASAGEDPWSTTGQFVVYSPQYGPSPLHGVFVVDLDAQVCSAGPTSLLANASVDWLRSLDCYDALELIALARRWEPMIGPDLACAGAQLLVAPDTMQDQRSAWDSSIQLLTALAEQGHADELSSYADELVDVIVAKAAATPEEFRSLANAAVLLNREQIAELCEPVFTSALEQLTRAPGCVPAWTAVLLAASDWQWPEPLEGVDYAKLVADIANGADAASLPALLTWANSMPFPPTRMELSPARTALTRFLLQEPQLATESQLWLDGDLIRRDLVAEAVAQLRVQSPAIGQSMLGGAFNTLAATAFRCGDPGADELRRYADAASIGALPAESRIKAMESRMYEPEAWWLLLAGTRPATAAELWAYFLRVHPDQSGVFSTCVDAVRSAASGADRRELKAVEPVVEVLRTSLWRDPRAKAVVLEWESADERSPGVWGRVRGIVGRPPE